MAMKSACLCWRPKLFLLRLTRLFMLLAAVFTLPAHALEGTLNCEIQNQNLLEINDGVGSQYKGYKNDLVVGDRVLFYYGLKDGQTFYFRSSEDPAKSEFWADFEIGLANAMLFSQNEVFINGIEYNEDPFLSKQFAMSADSFDIGFIFGEGGFKFKRYYKSDWMGAYTYINSPFTIHSYTLDCRHITDSAWRKIYSEVRTRLTK